jgi:hypothetical protein
MSVYFNIRNTLPKSGTFLLGHCKYAGVQYVKLVIVVIVTESPRLSNGYSVAIHSM